MTKIPNTEKHATTNYDDGLKKELETIKKLLIVQLVHEGISIRDIVKVTGMGSATLYKFLPKNLAPKEDNKNTGIPDKKNS